MSLRRAAARDLDAVAELWSLVTDHHARLDPAFAQAPGADSALRDLLRALLRDRDAAVLLWDGDAGPDGLCIIRVETAPPLLAERARATISDLGVREAARRRGAGRALVEAALAWARERGADRVEVRVAGANREGQAFWRALGFRDFMDILDRRL